MRRILVTAAVVGVWLGVPEAQAAGPAMASWTAIAKLPAMDDVWEIARGPGQPTGRRGSTPPLTPAYQAKYDAYKAAQARGEIQDQPSANCLPPGMPQIMDAPYPIEIVYAPGKIILIQEAYMQVRHIHTDGRSHSDDPDLTFNGHSIAKWDGQTLVVDTVGLVPEVSLAAGVPHSDKVRVVERLRLLDAKTLEIRTTITDPVVLAGPWEYLTHYARRHEWDINEYVCEQNNRNSVDPTGKAGINLNH